MVALFMSVSKKMSGFIPVPLISICMLYNHPYS